MNDQSTRIEASDSELIERAQHGDSAAFGELWTRHYRSAARVARQFTSSIDADDLVSEAYTRIYQRVLAGGGPTGAFRPYLYTTIRNLAASWGTAKARDVTIEQIEEVSDERIPDDPAAWALDRTLTARAFRTLPDRWQTVLWYTEIEGMDPHEVAPLLGMTPNGVAALSYRAREGLRTAWLQAHVSDAGASAECRWAIARIGGHARKSLTERENQRLEQHLADCTKCAIISDEVEEVGSHLALVLLPLTLGGVVGGAVLSQLAAGTAQAATVIPAMPASVVAGVTGTGGAVGGAAAAGAVGATATGFALPTIAGGLAAAAAITGAIVLGPVIGPTMDAAIGAAPTASASAHPTAAASADSASASTASAPASAPSGMPAASDSADGTVSGIASGVGGTVAGVTAGVGDTVSGVTSGVGGTVSGVTSGVGGTVSGVTSGVGGTVSGVTSGVGGAVGGSLGSTVSGVGSTVDNTVSGTGSALGSTVSGVGSTVGGTVSGVGSTLGGTVSGVGSALGGLLGGTPAK